MAARPRITTIIPTHNRAALLPRALDSAYSQEGNGELFDQEIIVVDDGSTDATPDVVQRYAGLRYIRLRRPQGGLLRGAATAQNSGIRASEGSMLAFLHDDDVWLPHRLRVQVPVLERHAEAGAVYSQEIDPSTGREGPDISRAASGWIFRELLERGNFVPVSTVLVRREALKLVGYFDEGLVTSEDWDLWLRLSFTFQVVFLPSAVAIHGESADGLMLTRAANGSAATDVARVFERGLQLLPEAARRKILEQRTWNLAWTRTHPVHVACRQALTAESPVRAIREFCAQLEAASPQRDSGERRLVRRTLAEIWVEIARCLASDAGTQEPPPLYEATRAVVRAPSSRLLKALLRVALRRVVAIADARYGRLRVRLERMTRH